MGGSREIRSGDPSGIGGASEERTANASHTAPSSPNDAERELSCLEKTRPQKIPNNWKMIACYAVGVFVGLAILTVIAAALVASHGTLGAIALAVFSKIHCGSALLAIHAAITPALFHGTAATVASYGMSIAQSSLLFLVLGGIAGRIYTKEKEKQKDKLCNESTERISKLAQELDYTDGVIPEEEIENKQDEQNASVLSSLLGKLCLQTKREQAHKGGFNVVKGFAHLFMSGAYNTLRAFFCSSKHHKAVRENYDREVQLKEESAVDRATDKSDKALKDLNEMRKMQLEQNVWASDAMAEAYRVAPELTAYDRNLLKLQVLRARVLSPEYAEKLAKTHTCPLALADAIKLNLKAIDEEIRTQKGLRNALVQSRLDPESDAYKALFNTEEEWEVGAWRLNSMLTLAEDVEGLGVTDEQKGQILEGISLLLNSNPKATIREIVCFVDSVLTAITNRQENACYWMTREWVLNHAMEHASNPGGGVMVSSPETTTSNMKAPMKYSMGEVLLIAGALRATDVGTSIIHASGIPGSGFVGAGVTGAATAVLKSGSGKRKVVNGAQGTAATKLTKAAKRVLNTS